MNKMNNSSFIEKAKLVHGDKYNYSKVEYNGSKNKVTIICPEHGEFEQIAANHLQGKGCRLCQYEKISNEFKLSNDKFINKCKKVHGDKYDYSKVKYNGWNSKVTIICPEHGSFIQNCNVHINGSGCPKCVSTSLDEVKKLLFDRFGDKFEYEFDGYINLSSKIKVICPIHGYSYQKVSSHLNSKYGCKKCYYNDSSLGTSEFIRRSKLIHGNEYFYDSVKYLNNLSPVDIFCKKHGFFSQKPSHHLRGSGCPACGIYKKSKISFDEFKSKANLIFKNKYKYEILDKWEGISGKVKVICPSHGESIQRCDVHFRGEGCPKCGSEKLSKSLTKSDKCYDNESEYVLKKIKKVHGNRYLYDNFVYRGSNNKSIITCKYHGDFNQRVSHHLYGEGCPKCNISKGELKIDKFLSENNIEYVYEKRVGKYRFDFYLPEINTFIEYDGEQHFKPIEFFGGKIEYYNIKNRDKNKDNYCKDNNINLIRIPYWEYNKIEYILYEKIIKKDDK